MGNRDWRSREDQPGRRDRTAGWRVVDRPRSGAPRVWRGQVAPGARHDAAGPDGTWPHGRPTGGRPVTRRERRVPVREVTRAGRVSVEARTAEPEVGESAVPWQPVLAWTIALFVVPMLGYLLWAWTRSGTPTAGCMDVADGACVAPRTAALSTFVDAFPGLSAAVALSLLASAVLRLLRYAWRPMTIALGGAVIGAGFTTAIVSALG